MRQYRGKIDDSGEAGDWVYGGIAVNGARSFIISIGECETCGKEPVCQKEDFPCYRNAIEVITETVGQQVGNKDKNGKDIYGSILIHGNMTKGGHIIATNPKGYEYRREVKWNNDYGQWSCYNEDTPWGQLDGAEAEDSVIIGDIYL